jgi:predicted type IV restriction endonuclease
MKKPVMAFVKDLKSNKKMHSLDEASIKQAVALRLLSLLGWDIFNVEEVYPDFSSESVTVSYALRIDGIGKMILDVKRSGENPDELHKQLVAFAVREAVDLAAHTDGARWWFYLPTAKGSLAQKRCHVCDLFEQKPEDMALDLMAFLSREKIVSGEYLESAKAAYQKHKRKMAADVLPDAWNRVLTGPNKILVEILSDATEKICGYKADPGMVEAFIRAHFEHWTLAREHAPAPPPSSPSGARVAPSFPVLSDNCSGIKTKKPEFFADKTITSFSFQGNTYPVKTWEDMLTTLCNCFASAHSQDFEKVLWLYDDLKPCFSRYSDQLRIPEKIRKTNIYVETKLPPDEIVKTVGDLLTEFGYGHDDLVITTQ